MINKPTSCEQDPTMIVNDPVEVTPEPRANWGRQSRLSTAGAPNHMEPRFDEGACHA
jgi:hypothetical protein